MSRTWKSEGTFGSVQFVPGTCMTQVQPCSNLDHNKKIFTKKQDFVGERIEKRKGNSGVM